MIELFQTIGAVCGIGALAAFGAFMAMTLAAARGREEPTPQRKPCAFRDCIAGYDHDGRHVIRASSIGRRRNT